MSVKLGDFLKSLNQKKTPMKNLDEDLQSTVKSYTPFIINRCMSYFPDTIIQSNNMNFNSSVSKEMHYDYFLYSVRKRNRFSPWLKKENIQDLDVVKEYFGYSDRKTREIFDLLSEEDIEMIKKETYRGGRA